MDNLKQELRIGVSPMAWGFSEFLSAPLDTTFTSYTTIFKTLFS